MPKVAAIPPTNDGGHVTPKLAMMGWSQRFWTTLARQIRQPSGWMGNLLGHLMAWEHRPLMRWGIGLMHIQPDEDVLEIGCGGGLAINHMAQLTRGSIHAVDYSDTMVKQATRRNRRLVDAGRVVVQQGDVSQLAFDDERFDVAIAIESFFFWPDPVGCLTELRRVLRPGGRLGLVVDSSKESPDRVALQKAADMLHVEFYSGDEIVRLMKQAGFARARFEALPDKGRGWLFVCGWKT